MIQNQPLSDAEGPLAPSLNKFQKPTRYIYQPTHTSNNALLLPQGVASGPAFPSVIELCSRGSGMSLLPGFYDRVAADSPAPSCRCSPQLAPLLHSDHKNTRSSVT